MIKYTLSLCIWFGCIAQAFASNIYVATNGNAGATGSLTDPFDSIQEAADAANPGDAVSICGGKYHESITLDGLVGNSTNRIVFQNHAEEEVVIAGTLPVTNGWTQWSQNSKVWKTTVSEDVWQLFVDGKAMTGARWPNVQKDWMEPDSGDGHNPTPFSYWDQETTWAKITDDSSWGHMVNDDLKFDLSGQNKSYEGGIFVGFRCLATGNDIFNALITNHVAGTADLHHTKDPYGESPNESQPADGARYFIEGHINCLDAPGEWFFDKGTGELYVWFRDSGSPVGRYIEAKNQNFALTLTNCEFLEFNGINLFGAAFKLDETYDTTFENCNFRYSSYLKKMLGIYQGGGVQDSYSAPFNHTLGGREPANLIWRNCAFFGYEGIGLYIRTFGSNLVENCWFHNGQFGRTLFGAVSDKKGAGTTLRRNTFHTLGLGNATKNGPHGVIEYNLAYNFMFEGDFSVYQIPMPTQPTTEVRYNWALNGAGRNGVRFDGDYANTNCLVHHTVSMNNNRGFRIKGDQHRVYNITGLGNGPKSDINIALEKFYGYDEDGNIIEGRRGDFPYHGNENSIVRNIAGDVIDNWPLIPTNVVGVWHGNLLGKTLFEELRDPLNWDFRPKAGSDLEDAGIDVPGFTEGYAGTAPDLGAYETGCTNYWIPGRIFPQASVPIPLDETLNARPDADLIWQPGQEALSHEVYFGTEADLLVFQTNQVNNIFIPGALQTNQTYYWRIDTVTGTGTTTGEVWHFTVADPANPTPINHAPYFTSVTFGAPAAIADAPYADSIAGQAVDPDGDAITYTKSAGPDWLNIETNGVLSGTPGAMDAGVNTWTVEVSDGNGATDTGFLSIGVIQRLILNFDVMDDAYVDDAYPTANYGASAEIELRTPNLETNGATRVGYMKFEVAVPTPLISAKLWIYKGTNVLSGGLNIYEVENHAWSEDSITWSNRPALTSNLLGSAVLDGNWFWTDVTSHVVSNGTYTFGLVRGPKISNRSVKSKENGTSAYLALELEAIPANSYLEWVSGTVSNALEWNPKDDPDANGLDNLFEYAVAERPDQQFQGEVYLYAYRRRTDAASRGLTYELERCDNLVSNRWTTHGISEVASGPAEPGFIMVTNAIPMIGTTNRFVRLKIELSAHSSHRWC
ncbi:hypothetical protein PDESU_04888 [Pontiella desulfatans]|uniref:Uncharacterized protein n=1 Tax=Pontiella desulfatans TaxID=2750659 RepID=A0A6C2U999_PONDE|nr:DNRLRE domain-containing protein [Pontiella desulfatans]VGO16297.1 hypothetical protein PDESU_04888 [Pontiella desulfatans]